MNLAWPTAQIAVMGAQGAVNILYRSELASAGDAESSAEVVRALRLLRSKRETLPPRKHGNIPL